MYLLLAAIVMFVVSIGCKRQLCNDDILVSKTTSDYKLATIFKYMDAGVHPSRQTKKRDLITLQLFLTFTIYCLIFIVVICNLIIPVYRIDIKLNCLIY